MASLADIRHNVRNYASTRLIFAVVILTLLAVLASALQLYAVAGYNSLKQQQRLTSESSAVFNTVLTQLRDADAVVRDYLAAPEPATLEAFTKLDRELPQSLGRLDGVATRAGMDAEASRIKTLSTEKMADLREVVALRDSGGYDAAQTLLRERQSKRLVDQVRAAIITEETQLSEELTRQQEVITDRISFARTATIVLFLLTIVTIAVVLIIFVRAIAVEKELERAKDEFVSLASHQLRTPASGVKSVLSMVLAEEFGELSDRQKYFLEKAAASNQSMLELVEDMLNVARFESGQFSINPKKCSLQDLVHATIFELRKVIEAKQQQLVLELPEVPIMVNGDEAKLRMVIGNIIDNASKYTKPRGRVTITVLERDNRGIIVIQDNGVGIAKQDLAHIFERFTRTQNELSEKVGGSGLGLYLAKIIVELHNGDINVTSRKGRGTTFTIALPQIGGSNAT